VFGLVAVAIMATYGDIENCVFHALPSRYGFSHLAQNANASDLLSEFFKSFALVD
jgi:hypothetical protein